MGARRGRSLNYRRFLLTLGAIGATAAFLVGPRSSTALSVSAGSLAPLWKPASVPSAPPPAALIGDASLQGQLRLSAARLSAGSYRAPLGGKRSARLTIDPAIQRRAIAVLSESKAIEGAVVVMGVDGRVLALAGLHADHPDKVDYKLPVKVWAPAASVFKLVTAAALLEAGVKTGTEVCYRGGVRSVERSHLRMDHSRDARCEDLTFGISRSQNAIIANLAHNHLDKPKLARAARKLGFGAGAEPDFAIDVEPNRITLPDDDLERARVAAGFWNTELSPLGGAMVASAIATGGIATSPRIVEAVIDGGEEIPVLPGPTTRVLPSRVAAALTRMMTATVASGTARKGFHDLKGRPFLGGIPVAGKTGSLSESKPRFRAYSWFVGFAPADHPRVVISVVLANPEAWRLKAHTAARLVLEKAL